MIPKDSSRFADAMYAWCYAPASTQERTRTFLATVQATDVFERDSALTKLHSEARYIFPKVGQSALRQRFHALPQESACLLKSLSPLALQDRVVACIENSAERNQAAAMMSARPDVFSRPTRQFFDALAGVSTTSRDLWRCLASEPIYDDPVHDALFTQARSLLAASLVEDAQAVSQAFDGCSVAQGFGRIESFAQTVQSIAKRPDAFVALPAGIDMWLAWKMDAKLIQQLGKMDTSDPLYEAHLAWAKPATRGAHASGLDEFVATLPTQAVATPTQHATPWGVTFRVPAGASPRDEITSLCKDLQRAVREGCGKVTLPNWANASTHSAQGHRRDKSIGRIEVDMTLLANTLSAQQQSTLCALWNEPSGLRQAGLSLRASSPLSPEDARWNAVLRHVAAGAIQEAKGRAESTVAAGQDDLLAQAADDLAYCRDHLGVALDARATAMAAWRPQPHLTLSKVQALREMLAPIPALTSLHTLTQELLAALGPVINPQPFFGLTALDAADVQQSSLFAAMRKRAPDAAARLAPWISALDAACACNMPVEFILLFLTCGQDDTHAPLSLLRACTQPHIDWGTMQEKFKQSLVAGWLALVQGPALKAASPSLVAMWKNHMANTWSEQTEADAQKAWQTRDWKKLDALLQESRAVHTYGKTPLPPALADCKAWQLHPEHLQVARLWQAQFPDSAFANLLLDTEGPGKPGQKDGPPTREALRAAAAGLAETPPTSHPRSNLASRVLDSLIHRLPLSAQTVRLASDAAWALPQAEAKAWSEHLEGYPTDAAAQPRWLWKMSALIARAEASMAQIKTSAPQEPHFSGLAQALGVTGNRPWPMELCHLQTQKLFVCAEFGADGQLREATGKQAAGTPLGRANSIIQALIAQARAGASTAALQSRARKLTTCALTGAPTQDPAMTADGEVYDRRIITAWLQKHDTAPMSGVKLANTQVVTLAPLASLLETDAAKAPTNVVQALQTQVADLGREAMRLARYIGALQSDVPEQAAALASVRNFRDSAASGLVQALSTLPPDVQQRVKTLSGRQIAITLPTNVVPAVALRTMGLGDQSLTLFLDFGVGSTLVPPRFSVIQADQVVGAGSSPVSGPTRWWSVAQRQPLVLNNLSGSIQRRAAYALTQAIAVEIRALYKRPSDKTNPIFAIDAAAQKRLASLTQACLVCAQDQGPTALARAVPCRAPTCTQQAESVALDLLQDDFRIDPSAVTMILSMAHAATADPQTWSRLQAPLPAQEARRLIPGVTALLLGQASDLRAALARIHANLPRLISWIAATYRGAIQSVPQNERIASTPAHVQQFRIYSTSPERDALFTATLSQAPSAERIVFHGTAQGRIFSILRDGLRNLSRDPLSTHGMCYGPGIYTATDSNTAQKYMNQGMGSCCLLICETKQNPHAASQSSAYRPPREIRVMTDEGAVALRYLLVSDTPQMGRIDRNEVHRLLCAN